MRGRQLAVVLAGLALVLSACGGSSGHKVKVGSLSANNHGTKDVTGMTTLSVEADNYYFEPTVLKGTPGQRLTLTIENDTGTNHNFSIDAQHVNTDVDAKHDETVTVTFPPSGTLSFFCEYHKARGMAGGLQSG
jgi:plastocyanin